MASAGPLGRGSPSRPRRRAVVVAVVLAMAMAAVTVLVWGPWAGGGVDRPNFVVIVTDDQRWDTLGSMPAVRRLLMTGGVTFRNAFVTTPSCCPSRVSLLTGQYSHRSGVLDGSAGNAPGGAPAFDDDRSLATWLDDAGYRTGLIGKYLNDYAKLPVGYVPPGWDEWFAIAQAHPQVRYYGYELNENGRIVGYGDEPSEYSTSVLRDKALRFVEGDGPFFLYFAPIAPHPPSTPAPDDLEAPVDAWDPAPSVGEEDLSDKPRGRIDVYDPATARSTRDRMLRSLLAVDRAVERIHDAVSDAGRLDQTYFLFTSDNGFLWGEHRLMGKVWPYEESIRVPLVIRPPGNNPTRMVRQMALNIDVAPTIADLAGVGVNPSPDGISLVPLLDDAGVPTRDRFVVEFLGFAPNVPPYSAIRTERFLYVEYRNGSRELYDLRADPFQLRNMLGEGGRAPPELVTELSGSLEALLAG